jgi:hypothetical protein
VSSACCSRRCWRLSALGGGFEDRLGRMFEVVIFSGALASCWLIVVSSPITPVTSTLSFILESRITHLLQVDCFERWILSG